MTRHTSYLVATLLVCAVSAAHAQISQAPQPDPALAHLPEVIQHDIAAWRDRLEHAQCIKVTLELEETWRNLHELDDDGSPRLVRRERFRVESWMTKDVVWMMIYPYEKRMGIERVGFGPHYEQLWRADTSTVWVRTWNPDTEKYDSARFTTESSVGPDDADFYSHGCIFASGMQSWIAGDGPMVENPTMTLQRSPNIAIVPPEPYRPGVWLDVIQPEHTRDMYPESSELYRRHDFMLLARNEDHQPEVREWRTIVLTDEHSDGKTPQEITGIRRFEYEFLDRMPGTVLEDASAFAGAIDIVEEMKVKSGGAEAR
ncbi:MAG: hypothetical protein H6815_07090 [Phycisphaeraceae bacterium]|nr:hypothetical protein [Phycisphaerales bacterium]MCB9860205.1 hypothetical protein [Phycisphaeraceae bacterium]